MNQDTRTIPAAIGAAFAGGFYAGQINVDGQLYALIMAGTEGELSGRWNAGTEAVPGAGSINNGAANTVAMAVAGSRLAQRVLGLNIGGFNDWYLPAKDELEMLYRAFKPATGENYEGYGANASSVPPGAEYTEESPAQTTVAALLQDERDALVPNWYWSSTQREALSDYAWGQDFLYGDQGDFHKSFAGRARAVRRLAI